MKEQTGNTYTSAPTAKLLAVSDAKSGKTTFLTAQLLGIWPGQNGGVVDRPSHLHVIAADAAAVKGFKAFALKHLGAPVDALNFRVYNIEDDVREAFAQTAGWDYEFSNVLKTTIGLIQERAQKEKGVHAMLFSSLTGVAVALKRGIQGVTGARRKDGTYEKGSGMDMAKWDAFSSTLTELRNIAQLDMTHCIWEGHLDKKTEGKGEEAVDKDSLGIQGASGKDFAKYVAEVMRIRRQFGSKVRGVVDSVYFDTAPSLSFVNSGRGFSELEPKEYCLATIMEKLNYETGRWGRVKGKVVAKPSNELDE